MIPAIRCSWDDSEGPCVSAHIVSYPGLWYLARGKGRLGVVVEDGNGAGAGAGAGAGVGGRGRGQGRAQALA